MNEKIIALEMKIIASEDQIDALNNAVYRQQQQIDTLVDALRVLQHQARQDLPRESLSLQDEIPPHY